MIDDVAFMSLMFAAALVVLHIWRWGNNRARRKMTWWELQPDGSQVEWNTFLHVFGGARRKHWPGAVALARFGDFDAGTRIWAGVAGIKEKRKAIEQLARSAGAQVGEQGVPPWPRKGGTKWRLGITEPRPREADATNARERHLDEMLIPERPTFPDAVDDYFNTREDAFVVICRPGKKPNRIHTMAATTVRALDTDITDAAAVRRRWMFPSAAWVASVILSGTYMFWLYYYGFIGESLGLSALAGAAVWLILFSWRSWALPPPLRALRTGRLPKFTRAARRGAALPVWQMGQWAAGTDRAQIQAPRKNAPPEAIIPDGAYLGKDPRGNDCYLGYNYRYRGIIAYGDPGTGKSNLLRVLLASDALQRATGRHMNIIWIESKSKRGGAIPAMRTLEACGLKPLLLSGSSVMGPRLSLVDTSDPESAARILMEAIRFAYSKQDIMEQSAEILDAVFRAAAAFTPKQCAQIGLPFAPPNLIAVAYRLLDAVPEVSERAKAIVNKELPSEHAKPLVRYYRMKRDFENRREPVINKLKGLLPAEGLFETANRPVVTFQQLLTAAQPTVIDLAPPEEVTDQYTKITASRVSSMSMYMLWDTIRRLCDDWQAQGKYTVIYSDELRDIAGLGDDRLEVIQEIADQGRSRGVLPVFGTQRPNNSELREATRSAVNSFGTQFYFSLRETQANEAAAANLRGEYLPVQLSALPEYHCVASVSHKGAPSAAYMLNPPDADQMLQQIKADTASEQVNASQTL